jgi:transposase-like protein
MPGRVLGVGFKRSVVGELERKEKSIAQICQEHQLAESQVHKWRKLFGSEKREKEKVRDMDDQGKGAMEAEADFYHLGCSRFNKRAG